MESFTYPQFPTHLSNVHIALFTAARNASQLRARLIKASTADGADGDTARAAVNFAFIEAKLVTSRLHLQTAIYQSVLASAQNALRTKTVHSEILWSLNTSNNITEAFRRFGVSDASEALLIVRVGPPSDFPDVEAQMKAAVDGDLVPMNALAAVTDWSLVKKYYKLNGEPAVTVCAKDPARQRAVVDELVTSFVAMKCVMS